MKLITKAIIFYLIATVVALVTCGAFDVLFYWVLNAVGLSELGNLTAFQIGLGITQTSICIYIVSELSEEIVYGDEEDDVFNF